MYDDFINNLKNLYRSDQIAWAWSSMQNQPIIQHPIFGNISPNEYRSKFNGKICPFCNQNMVHGKNLYSTNSREEAIDRNYEYLNKHGRYRFNLIGGIYFHPNYVTIDHKVNKARCPELMFDYQNLQIVCMKCNNEKGDDNTFDVRVSYNLAEQLSQNFLNKYKKL
jgi:hypothetical protein